MTRANFNDAITTFKLILEVNPDAVECRKKLGYAFFGSKQYLSAICEFKKVLLLQPADHKTLLWLKAAQFEESQSKVINTNAPTAAYTRFIEEFEREFVSKIKDYNNKLEGKDLRASDDVMAMKLFGSFAKLLPDLNVGVAPSPVSATIHLSEPVTTAIQTSVDQLVAVEKLRAHNIHDLGNVLSTDDTIKLKAFAKVIATRDDLLKAIIHTIACNTADCFPNILNMFTEKSIGDAGKGIAQRIIRYFADHMNNENLSLEEQINLAIYEGKCDMKIELYKKDGRYPYSLDSVITKSAILTPTGHLYYRQKPKVLLTTSFGLFKNISEHLPFHYVDRHKRYGIRIGQPSHQLVSHYKEEPISEIINEGMLSNALKR